MKVKYLHYDNTDGSILGYTTFSDVKPQGYYLEDEELPDDYDDEYYEVVDNSGQMVLQKKNQTEIDAIDDARTDAENLSARTGEVQDLSYTFYKALKDNWATLDSGFTTALSAWKTSMDQIWTDHPE